MVWGVLLDQCLRWSEGNRTEQIVKLGVQGSCKRGLSWFQRQLWGSPSEMPRIEPRGPGLCNPNSYQILVVGSPKGGDKILVRQLPLLEENSWGGIYLWAAQQSARPATGRVSGSTEEGSGQNFTASPQEWRPTASRALFGLIKRFHFFSMATWQMAKS